MQAKYLKSIRIKPSFTHNLTFPKHELGLSDFLAFPDGVTSVVAPNNLWKNIL